MRYELMFPDQIRQAIAESWPAVMAAGVLEYHAEHCVVGVDTLLVVRALEELEREMNIVILPPFCYGAAGYVVEPPENNGTLDVDASAIHGLVREIFKGLLRIGFRNIHVFVHHQSENFTAGMPTDLAFKLAGRQVVLDFQQQIGGKGWWGDNSMADYFSKHIEEGNPFNWIQVHPFMDEASQRQFPIDHAGKQESSLMMAFCPEGVDMSRLTKRKWYCEHSDEATPEHGAAAREMILQHMRSVLAR